MKKIFRFLEKPYIDIFLATIIFIYALRNNDTGIKYFFPLLIFFIGLSVWIIGFKDLGKWFSMLPRADKIVSRGIYSKVRHPIYLGSTIAVMAICLVGNKPWMWSIWAILILVQVVRAKIEEQKFFGKFGAEYLHYKNSTWF